MVVAPDAARHAATIAQFLNKTGAAEALLPRRHDVAEWGEANYYIPHDSGRARLIKLLPHQKVILKLFFDENIAHQLGCEPNFQTLVFSTVKKSGKTAIAGMVARWVTETWGSHVETYSMANDLEQARGRIYAAALASIELDPRYELRAKGIPGQWRVIENQASYTPTHSKLKAVSADYKGEAGSNPVATFWSELWGYSSEASQRLWEELTPVPTRPRSIRYVETYAGYEGESGILNDLEDRVKNEGKRLTLDELRGLGLDWPWEDQPLPFYVHLPSRTIAYWDDGENARRMPWQTSAYYAAQEAELRPQAYRRLHLNFRSSSTEDFIPIEWWDRLVDLGVPTLDHSTPVVMALDGSVSGDCSAASLISRHPTNKANVAYRDGRVWTPSDGKPLDYSQTIEPYVRTICTGHNHTRDLTCDKFNRTPLAALIGACPRAKPYNVVSVVYDEFQLHDLTTRLRNEAVAWFKKFSQQSDRSIADKALFDAIRDQRISHNGDENLREHIRACGAKIPKDDNSKLRLIKKAAKSKIDLAVATSMAAHECQRLNLG